jgi:hypothetical protein
MLGEQGLLECCKDASICTSTAYEVVNRNFKVHVMDLLISRLLGECVKYSQPWHTSVCHDWLEGLPPKIGCL